MRGDLILLAVMAAACGGPDQPDEEGSAPVITSAAPADATEDEPYRYAPFATDDDGAVAWRQTAAHTCGGSVDATTGEVVFTPTGPVPPASCTLAIEACDRGVPVRCTTQTEAVTIRAVNDAPAITSTAPDTALEDVAVVYRQDHADPDGPGATWALLADHTCGGQLDAATGELRFAIAGPTPPATCTLATQVCDGGSPSLCATQRQELVIIATNDPPLITSAPPALATEDLPYTYQAIVLDLDGPAVTWALMPGHTCGGTIDSSGLARFTIAGPIPPPSCRLELEACDGGDPEGCILQGYDVTITAIDDPPVAVADSLMVMQDSSARATDVRVNDLDADGGIRVVAAVTAPSDGVATVMADGAGVSYTPRPGYCNSQVGGVPDQFTYQLAPGGSTATVTVRVMCPGRAIAVASSGSYTCTVFDNGVVRCWGENAHGQLGLGDTVTRGDQPDEMGPNLPPVDLGVDVRAVAVTTGTRHACALLADGGVKCWGSNQSGELGLGDNNARGDEPGEMGDALPRVDLGTGRTAVAVHAGPTGTCAILDDRHLKCWGDNIAGQLGLGDTRSRGSAPGQMGDNLPAVQLPAGRAAVELAGLYIGTCAVLNDGSLRCWGSGRGDAPGEMGDAVPAVALGTGRVAVSVADHGDLSGQFRCIVFDDGAVKCFGANDLGQLGLGDRVDRYNTATLGDALPVVNLGAGRAVAALDVGLRHSCARFTDATIKCWGANGTGQLGLGSTIGRGSLPEHMGDNLPTVSLGAGRTAVAVATGWYHSCAALDDGTVKCWGANNTGQLGLGDTAARGDAPGEMGDALPAVDL